MKETIIIKQRVRKIILLDMKQIDRIIEIIAIIRNHFLPWISSSLVL